MYVVAGVWTGFDEEWLIYEVEAQRVGLAGRGWGLRGFSLLLRGG